MKNGKLLALKREHFSWGRGIISKKIRCMLDGDKDCGEHRRRAMGRPGRGEEGLQCLRRAARRVSLRKEHLSKRQGAETPTGGALGLM